MISKAEENMFKEDFGEEWYNLLKDAIQSDMYAKLREFIGIESTKYNIFPPRSVAFKAFKLAQPSDIRVVILGQNPYHTPGIADGLAFSCGNSKHPQPSLQNILIEVEKQIYDSTVDMLKPKYYNLERWAKQGIFLLNCGLTVREGQAESHIDRWRFFIEFTLHRLSCYHSGIIYLLWGKYAQSFKIHIDPNLNYILMCGHPMTKSYKHHDTWSNNGHFAEVNKILMETNGTKIDW